MDLWWLYSDGTIEDFPDTEDWRDWRNQWLLSAV